MQALHRSRLIYSDLLRCKPVQLLGNGGFELLPVRTYHRTDVRDAGHTNHVRNLSRRNRHLSRISGTDIGFDNNDVDDEHPLREQLVQAYNDSLTYCRCELNSFLKSSFKEDG